MNDDLQADTQFLRGRQNVLKVSFSALALAVMALSGWRLSSPLSSLHVSVKVNGEAVNATKNPFEGVAGSLQLRDGTTVALNFADTANDRTRGGTSSALLTDVTGAIPLLGQLQAPLRDGMRSFVRTAATMAMPAGRRLELTLDPGLQQSLLDDSTCFVGHIEHCSNLPPNLQRADRRFVDSGLGPRAGAVGFVVVEEDSGAVIAKGGAISDCSANALRRKAFRVGRFTTKVFASDSENCAQFPDLSHWQWQGYPPLSFAQYQVIPPGLRVAYEPPLPAVDFSDWAFNPGSTHKISLAVACARVGKIGDLVTAREKFARSSDNDYFRTLALNCVDQYRMTYGHYAQPVDVLRPLTILREGIESLLSVQPVPDDLPQGPVLDAKRYLELDGIAARKGQRHAKPSKAEREALQTSRDLTTIAIGDGGARSFLVSHARQLRLIGLTSRGLQAVPVIHLARDIDEPTPLERDMTWLPDEKGSQSVLYLLSGVTSSIGTARLACQRIAGPCPASGLPQVYGKTGTSDISAKATPWLIKKTSIGDPVPSKLFVARFEVAGKWYVVAAQALRSRDPFTHQLDETNAAAEIGLLARQHLLDRVIAGKVNGGK